MRRKPSLITHVEFMGMVCEVNAGKKKNKRVDWVILKAILSQLETMINHHNKVVVIRFDLHQQHYTPNSKHLNIYFRQVIKKAKRKYNLSRVGYGWVREVERAKKQHYHCFIILDGNKVKNAYQLMEDMRKDWLFRTDSSFHIPDKPVHRITRHNEKETGEAIYRLSYLAKERGKGYKATNARDYSTSRLKS